MGFKRFLSNIFSNKNTDQVSNGEISKKVASGNIVDISFEGRTLYPLLVRFDDDELTQETLLSIFHGDESTPIVVEAKALVAEKDGEVSLLAANNDTDNTLDYYYEQSRKNLNELDFDFVFSPEFNDKVIIAGGMFASEAILSEKIMLQAHDMLDSEKIQVSIAKRGVIMISSADLDDELMKNFVALHLSFFIDNDEESGMPLCDDIFILRKGIIESAITYAYEGK